MLQLFKEDQGKQEQQCELQSNLPHFISFMPASNFKRARAPSTSSEPFDLTMYT